MFVFKDWGEGSPDNNCPSDNWSARFTANVFFSSGNYTFALGSDDWGRIWLGNDLVVDNWQGRGQHYEGRNLGAGTYQVKVEFADTLGSAKLAAWWWGPGYDMPRQSCDTASAVWCVNYWGNKDLWWDSVVRLTDGSDFVSYNWGDGSPGYGLPSDRFSTRFERTRSFAAGRYRFTVTADDGVRFWVDNQMALDKWQAQSTSYTVELDLSGGAHALKLEHFEDGGGARIGLSWEQVSVAVPTAPVLQLPADGSSMPNLGPLQLLWNQDSGTVQYQVQVIPLNNDGYSIDNIIGDPAQVASASYTIQPPVMGQGNYVMLPGATYNWRVRVTFKSGFISVSDASWGPWSNIRTFKTPRPSSATVVLNLVTPSATPTLSWKDSNVNIFLYEVQLSQDHTFNTDPATATAAVYFNVVHGGMSDPLNSWRTPPGLTLEAGKTYYWRVRPRVQATPNGPDELGVAWTTANSFLVPGGGPRTFTVNSPTDAVDANPGDGACRTTAGVCTLRAAVQEANALSGADTINLPAGTYQLTIPGVPEDAAAKADLDILDSVTIAGAGAGSTGVDGGQLARVFDIHGASIQVTLSGMTIRNGAGPDGGGAIWNRSFSAIVTIADSVIRDSSGTGAGGIYNYGTMHIEESLIVGNTNHNTTGGISNLGTMTIDGSSIVQNAGYYQEGAGGISNSGTLTITNSTISGNTFGNGTGAGGFTSRAGTATIVASTITENSNGVLTGGIRVAGGAVTLKSSIVAYNGGSQCGGQPLTSGFNLSSDLSCGLTAPSDHQGVAPGLGPLADNGGPTLTHALLPGSPAIDAGDNANCPATDQRGVSRPQGAACDIGAYEADTAAQNTWTLLASSSPPPVRSAHTAVWDATLAKMIVFGGQGAFGYLNDLWSYDAASKQWAQLAPASALPQPRRDHAAVWDAATQRMIVYGGHNQSYLGDLWSYSPSANAWTQLTPPAPNPGARAFHSAVWDPEARRMLVFGGRYAGNLNDVWSYDPTANAWALLTSTGTAPTPRSHHAAVWDAREGRMLMFGGETASDNRFNDIWGFRPSGDEKWMRLTAGGAVPPGAAGLTAVWEPQGAQLLAYGGGNLNDTNNIWSYRDATFRWTSIAPLGQRPSVRDNHAAVWDAVRGQMLVFGGCAGSGGCISANDLWSYRLPAPGPAVSLVAFGGQEQTGLVNTNVLPFSVKTLDLGGAPVSGITVQWAIASVPAGAAGQSLSPDSNVTTDAQGSASAVLRLGSAPGDYVVTAVAAGLAGSPVAFTVHAINPAGIRFRLHPNPARVALGDGSSEVQVWVDAGTQAIDAADFRLTFDPNKLQAADADGNAGNGVQLTPGPVFATILQNTVDNVAGTADFAAGRGLDQASPSGSIHLATLRLRGLAAGTWPLAFVPNSLEVSYSGLRLPVVWDDGAAEVSAVRLNFAAWPVRGASDVLLGVQPVVVLRDGQGNTLTGDSSTVVTLALAGPVPSGATLTCDQTSGGVTRMTALNGVAAFTGCKLDQSAMYVLEATAPGFAAAQTPVFHVTLAGDVNGDCRVSALDFSLLVTHFGQTSAAPSWTDPALLAFRADLNGDGRVSPLDFSILVSHFGAESATCAPPGNAASP